MNESPTPLPHRAPAILLLVAVASGIFFERFIVTHFPTVTWLAAAGVLLVIWGVARGWSATGRSLALGLLFLSWACLGAARHHEHWRCFLEHDVAHLDLPGELPMAIRCRILTPPVCSPLAAPNPLATTPLGVQTRFHAAVVELRNGSQWEPASGRLAVRVDGHVLQRRAGDLVEMYGALRRLPAPQNPGELDRRTSYRSQRILCRCDVPHPDCVVPLEEPPRPWVGSVGSLRVRGLELLDRYVGAEHSALAGALLLGARDRLSRERVEKFFRTGTIHLLAISGLHIGILAWGFFFFAERSLYRRTLLVSLIVGTVLYCQLTGLRAPVMRASTLVIVVCLSRYWRRKFSAWNALSLAALFILLWRPGSLFLPGAQLSFLAVATLIGLSESLKPRQLPPLEKLVHETQPLFRRWVAAICSGASQLAKAGAAIWVVTLPLTMYWFHLCSPISLVLNVLLSVPITIGLLSGFGVLVLGSVSSFAGHLLGQLCRGSLGLVELVVQWGHAVPEAYFWVSGPSVIWCCVFYLVILLAPRYLVSLRLGGVMLWFVAWLALPLACEFACTSLRPPAPTLQCTFLSVGHGTCVVLETPDDRVFIYDAGRMGVPEFGVGIVSEFLWSRGRTHIDGVLLSHADADHYNLLPGLLERFTIGECFMSARMWSQSSSGLSVLRGAIAKSATPLRMLSTHDVIHLGDVTATVLHPGPQGVDDSDNANSIVLEVAFQGRKILLPGDLESKGMEEVLEEPPRDVDLVMAPHHGSARSEPRQFTSWCTPEYVVISGGHSQRSADDPVITRSRITKPFGQCGAKVFHTAYDGAICCFIADGELRVTSFRPGG